MSWFRRAVLALMLLLLLILLALGYTTLTQSGLRQVLGAAERFSGGQFSWQQVSGRLFGSMQVQGVAYVDNNGQRASVQELVLKWQPWQILHGKLQLDTLQVSDIDIHVPAARDPAEQPSGPFTLPAISSLPVAVDVRELTIRNLSVFAASGDRLLLLQRLQGSAAMRDNELKDLVIKAVHERAEVVLTGNLETVGDWPLELAIDWSAHLNGSAPVQGQGKISGDLNNLDISQKTTGPVRSSLQFNLQQLLQQPVWNASFSSNADDAGAVVPLLAGMPLSLAGVSTGQLTENGLDLQRLEVRNEQAELVVSGTVEDEVALQAKLQVGDLSRLFDGAAGSANINAAISGRRETPAIVADMKLQALHYQQHSIGDAVANATIDLSGQRESQLRLDASAVRSAAMRWDTVKLALDGWPQQHSLSLQADGAQLGVSADATGVLEHSVWRGEIRRLALNNAVVGNWLSEEATPLTLSSNKTYLKPLCLKSSLASLCIEANLHNGAGPLKARLTDFPLARLQPLLAVDAEFEQRVDGQLTARIDSTGFPRARLSMVMPPAAVRFHAEERNFAGWLGEGRLIAKWENNELTPSLKLDLGRYGHADFDGVLTDPGGNAEVDGIVRASFVDLTVLSLFVPQVQQVDGRLEANVRLAGTLDRVVSDGSVMLRGFTAELPRFATKIEDGNLLLRSDNKGIWQVNGTARSGQGDLSLRGTSDPATRSLALTLRGDDFQLAGSRALSASVSPDLDITLARDGVRVRGKVLIPRANFKSGTNAGAVRLSEDVVIVGREHNTAPPRASTRTDIDVDVMLGDNVRIEAGNFEGSVAGNLAIVQRPGGVATGAGTIEVVNGDYLIYGQKLTVERGNILFGGGPLGNPRLDIDVLRDLPVYEVKAGARIRGNAAAPSLQLYSEPVMTDADVLSYIVLGQPRGSRGGSYTLGRFLTPDLYVSYGIALFNGINTFNLRYRLSDRLTLQAERGKTRSADLVYTIER